MQTLSQFYAMQLSKRGNLGGGWERGRGERGAGGVQCLVIL